jgi:hypothetical protein
MVSLAALAARRPAGGLEAVDTTQLWLGGWRALAFARARSTGGSGTGARCRLALAKASDLALQGAPFLRVWYRPMQKCSIVILHFCLIIETF